MKKLSTGICYLITLYFFLFLALPISAQDDAPRLQLVGVDASEFPIVRVTILTAGDQSRPLTDLSQLTLHENGSPVTDISYEKVPAGVDVVFVIDANPDIVGVDDDSGLTRLEKVRESIRSFAESYMNPSGLDRVSIIVPSTDGQGGEYLIQDETASEAVIAAIDAYQPETLQLTPLNAMVELALDQMEAETESPRFHAVLLFTDGRRLPDQLSYPLLTAQANDSNTPIYVAIIGAVADEFEIDNARRLYEPTRATYVHMPTGSEEAPIYEIWQQQGDQIQLVYRSQQRQSGRNQMNITLGSTTVGDSFEVALQPPEVLMPEESLQIHRVGATHDSALTDLQPAVQSITAAINWPDDLPRMLRDVTLLVNDQPQVKENAVSDQPVDSITINWDISSLGQGDFDLVLTVTDELGYQGTSAVMPAHITSEWPPAPTVVPTPQAIEEDESAETAQPALSLPWENMPWLNTETIAAALATLLFLAFLLFWRRRGQETAEKNPQDLLMTAANFSSAKEMDQENLIARLEPFAGTATGAIEITGKNMTIGKDEELSDIVITHPSLALLHARIRHQEDEYWLFDEGSAGGTHLNYERLGLAPRILQDGDVVQFGTVNYRFRLRPQGFQDGDDLDELASDQVVILDMDGLMVNTEPLSRQAWDKVLMDLGSGPLDDDFYKTLIGYRLWETSEMLVTYYNLPIEPDELGWRKKVLFAEILSAGVPTMPGLFELLTALKQRGIDWAVATSNSRQAAETILTKIGLSGKYKVLAAGDEVPNGKPAPDVYLLAAERLHIAPEQCLAIEDSSIGCRAAYAAGMMVIAIPHEDYMEEKFECADHIMTSLLDVSGRLDEMLDELRRR
ncbi:MAG: HAD-IA family hydrolase [Candidatus Promineifilaceae bacterium]